jgi:hypothetical protein
VTPCRKLGHIYAYLSAQLQTTDPSPRYYGLREAMWIINEARKQARVFQP